MTKSKELRQHIIGKKIVKIKLNRFHTGRSENPWTYDPTIIFEDGTRLAFIVIETEVSEYGIEPIVIPA